MKILVTGNMGYVGPSVVARLRASHPEATLLGLDAGYFAHCLSAPDAFPERVLNRQYFGDVRDVQDELLEGVDAVVHLAGISNDPIGNAYEDLTMEVNHRATAELARRAKRSGARSFTFASSCSVYGFAEDGVRTESSAVDPLTAYARSKVAAERDLEPLAGDDFVVTCLRFATACGMSDRVRLDLVLNDFVAGAVTTREVLLLSDGSPWRPLIHVQDMARAIDWAVTRPSTDGGRFLVVNAGSDEWNYQVRDLAIAVAQAVPGTHVSIPETAAPDSRSYRVSFELFRRLAPDHQPQIDLESAILDLRDGLERIGLGPNGGARDLYVRLSVLRALQANGLVTDDLVWSANGSSRTSASGAPRLATAATDAAR